MPLATQPLVSIVVTVYRRTQFLKTAISSALGQTYRDIEVLVAEDGGSDCAAEIVSSIHDPRLTLCRAERHTGEAGNRLCAYEKARGLYYVNLDDDDVLRPEFVEKLVEPLERFPEVVVSFCDHYVSKVDGTIDPDVTNECSRVFCRNKLAAGMHEPLREFGLTAGTIPMNVGAMFRRRLVWPDGREGTAALPLEAGAADDLYLYYLACVSGGLAYYLPERLSEYRIHDQQLTTLRLPETSEGFVYCYRKFLADERLREQRRSLRQALAHSMTCSGFDMLRRRERQKARSLFRDSVTNSMNLRSLSGLILSLLPSSATERCMSVRHRLARPDSRANSRSTTHSDASTAANSFS